MSLPFREQQPARLLCPWDSPGKSTRVGCHFLLQGIFPTQGSNPPLLYETSPALAGGSLLSTTWEAQVFELTEIKGRWINRPPDSAASKHVHTHKNCCSPQGLKSFGASIPRSRPPGALQLCRRAEKSLCTKAGPSAFCSFSPQAFAARVTYNCLRVLSRFPLRWGHHISDPSGEWQRTAQGQPHPHHLCERLAG